MNFPNNEPTDLCVGTDTGYSWYYVRKFHVTWEQGKCGHCCLIPIFSPKNMNSMNRCYPILQWEIFKTSRTNSCTHYHEMAPKMGRMSISPSTHFLLTTFLSNPEGRKHLLQNELFFTMQILVRDSSIQTQQNLEEKSFSSSIPNWTWK